MREERRISCGELRTEPAKNDNSSGTIVGYAAVFNQLSEDLGRFREKIAYGAFSESITKDVRALWSHDQNVVLGRTKNGTLRLREDNVGLSFELDLPNTTAGKDALTSIRRKDVSGMSFGFFVQEDSWARGKGADPHIRTLLKVDLFEVSPVAFPAYPQTDVSTRGMAEVLKEIETKWAYEEKEKDTGHKIEALRPKVARMFFGLKVNA